MDTRQSDRTLALGDLIAHARMAYIETDADLRVSQWSQGAKDLFRHSENEARGRFLNELIPVSKDPLIQCARAGTMSIFHGPGQNIQCDITYAPIMTLQAEKMGVALLAINTSDKLKEETDLNQKNQHLEEMYGVAPIGIYHVNLEGDITMANSEYAWMLGYESSDAVVNQIKNFTTQVFLIRKKPKNLCSTFLKRIRSSGSGAA